MNIATGPMKSKTSLLFIVAGALTLASTPNYSFLPAVWIAPLLWLFLARELRWKIFVPVFILIQAIVSIIGNIGIFPFPLPMMIIFYLIISVISAIPYLLDKLTDGKIPTLLHSLIFPSAMVVVQFVFAQGPSGTWGNIAYTQTSWILFMQSVSLGGIWLIDFMIYWFAPMVLLIRRFGFKKINMALYIIPILVLLGYGLYRLNISSNEEPGISIAGIVANPLPIGEALLFSEYGETLTIAPDIAQSDPLIQRLNQAYINFLEDPYSPRYKSVRNTLRKNTDDLFLRAEKYKSMDLVTWSEGAFQLIKPDEEALIERASALAKTMKTTLFLPLAVFHTGQVSPGVPFLENKIITISDEGQILHSYYKNVPVKGLEPSIPGDGNIPQIEIGAQRISPAICYDADFPGLIAQTGRKSTSILVLPSSDWKAIEKVHAHMALTRAIENDVTLFRPTANGYTIAVSGRGNVLFKESSFDGFEEVELDDLPGGSSNTFFSMFPNMVPLIALTVMSLTLLISIPKVQRWLTEVWTTANVSSTSN